MSYARTRKLLTAAGTLLFTVGTRAAGSVQVYFETDMRLGGDQPYTEAVIKREPSMAVNLKNLLNVVAFNRDQSSARPYHPRTRVAYTTDGGASWTLGAFAPSGYRNPASGDPAVVSDSEGNFWFVYFDSALEQAGYLTDSRLSVARPSDGGQSFDRLSSAVHSR